MKSLYATLIVAAVAASSADAQQRQPNGTYRFGEAIMRERMPPPAQQRSNCRSAQSQVLGMFGMNFVGVEAWIGHHPMLERNCATLVDILPISQAPHVEEFMAANDGLWSVVLKLTLPTNDFGWKQAFAFAWCSDTSCARNVLLIFDETQIIGFCSARPGPNGGTRYTLTNIGDSRAFTATGPYRSCIEEARKSVGMIAGASHMPGAEVIAPPPREAIEREASQTRDRGAAFREQQAQYAEAARRQAQIDAQHRAAAAQWERLRRPNSIGW